MSARRKENGAHVGPGSFVVVMCVATALAMFFVWGSVEWAPLRALVFGE